MYKHDLIKKTRTNQVTALLEELLSDGQPHTRREIEEYVKNRLSNLDLPLPSNGHISGGIHSAVKKGICYQPERAVYQSVLEIDHIVPTRKARVLSIIRSAIDGIAHVAHEIDYLEADESELQELETFKHCINELKKNEKQLSGS